MNEEIPTGSPLNGALSTGMLWKFGHFTV